MKAESDRATGQKSLCSLDKVSWPFRYLSKPRVCKSGVVIEKVTY